MRVQLARILMKRHLPVKAARNCRKRQQGGRLAYNSYHGILLLGSLGTPFEQSSQVGEHECRVRRPTYVYCAPTYIAIIALNVLDEALSLWVCLFEEICDQFAQLVARGGISAILYVRMRIAARR